MKKKSRFFIKNFGYGEVLICIYLKQKKIKEECNQELDVVQEEKIIYKLI